MLEDLKAYFESAPLEEITKKLQEYGVEFKADKLIGNVNKDTCLYRPITESLYMCKSKNKLNTLKVNYESIDKELLEYEVGRGA